jgi:hypothetical protein
MGFCMSRENEISVHNMELSFAKILAVHGMRNLGRSRTLAVR